MPEDCIMQERTQSTVYKRFHNHINHPIICFNPLLGYETQSNLHTQRFNTL